MYATSALTAGSHSITAQYAGNTTYAASNSTALSQIVNPATLASTTAMVTSSANPSTVGQSVMFTATVSSQTAGTITGTVTFFDGTTQIGLPATLSGGSAVVSTSTLAAGTQSITAQYSGDTNYAASTSLAIVQIVNAVSKAATSTGIATSQSPTAPGANVTFTATVTTASGTPTGTVTFLDGTTSLGRARLAQARRLSAQPHWPADHIRLRQAMAATLILPPALRLYSRKLCSKQVPRRSLRRSIHPWPGSR